MGLTNPREPRIGCGVAVADGNEPSGGDPEVEPELFDAVVHFESLEGCIACHARDLRLMPAANQPRTIHAYTDLLLHDLGAALEAWVAAL